ncbi:MAG: GMC family oxidoreductase [Algibacter sp.]
MYIDARKLENDSLIEGDICIVGAGAAGISIALEWINTPYDIILLEGGGFEYDEEIQDLYDGKTTGQKYFPLKSSRLHSYGGTTWMWAGMSSPYDNIDFTDRDWVPNSGWPISKQDLDPFYIRTQEKLDLGAYEYNLKYWKKKLPDMNPFPLDEDVIDNKMWEHSNVKFGEKYYDALGDAKNIYQITYANVVDIQTNKNTDKVKKIVSKNHTGKTLHVKAKYFILACGAIQNSRLLLASNSQMPKGLGNNNDLVGRHFMEHIEMVSSELNLFDSFPTSLYTVNHGITKVHGELALTEKEQKKHKILNGTVSLMPLNIGEHRKPRIETWKNKNPLKALEFNAKHMKASYEKALNGDRNKLTNRFQLITRMEQAPIANSRITISHEKDKLGVPKANFHWEFSDLEKKSIRKLHQIIKEQFEKSKIGQVELLDFLKDENDKYFPKETTPGWHHMGGTRMSNNPKKGVVDLNCKVHGISNLFIAGSSCFPTSGAPNPTLTLIALSIRLSDYLKKII